MQKEDYLLTQKELLKKNQQNVHNILIKAQLLIITQLYYKTTLL